MRFLVRLPNLVGLDFKTVHSYPIKIASLRSATIFFLEKKDAYTIVAVADAVKVFGKKFGVLCWLIKEILFKVFFKTRRA